MLIWNRTSKSIYALVAIAAYFVLAEWARDSYVDPTPVGKIVIRLNRPFERYSATTLAVVSYQLRLEESLEQLADNVDNMDGSTLLLYEDGRLLGPAHSNHEDIATRGEGRYSHWKKTGFLFSASDNSDPNRNGRSYWTVVP